MNTFKRLLVLFMVSFCILGLGGVANAAAQNPSNQICFNMVSNPDSGVYNVLKLGVMDYGNGHMALAGTDFDPSGTGLVHGSADWFGDIVEISLDGSMTLSGGLLIDGSDNPSNPSNPSIVAFTYTYRLEINPVSLSGTFVIIPGYSGSPSETHISSGTVTVVECP